MDFFMVDIIIIMTITAMDMAMAATEEDTEDTAVIPALMEDIMVDTGDMDTVVIISANKWPGRTTKKNHICNELIAII